MRVRAWRSEVEGCRMGVGQRGAKEQARSNHKANS